VREDLAPTRYTLLGRLHNWDDQESWRDFFDTYWQLIYSVAIRCGLSDDEAQDVVQETVICVAKEIQNFQRNRELGSFKSWLCQLTRWRIADQLRKRDRAELQPGGEAGGQFRREMLGIPDESARRAETIWDDEWREHRLATALTRVKRSVSPEQYQMFDLYAVKGRTAGEVARLFQVSESAVYVAKHRVSTMIKLEIEALKEEEDQPQAAARCSPKAKGRKQD
jgi:RNA polymerase sigma factor (sigma-70 family)